MTLNVVGTHGNCTIPSGATGIVANVTIDLPTAAGFLTLFPADAASPLASNLNWVAGQAPTPNQVSVALSASGAINVFNNAGTVEVIIDITAFLSPGGGAAGPPGVSAPILLTDKAQYESATGDVTFNGIGWDDCSAINIDVFGGGGTDAGTNITPVGGTFTGRFPVPDAVGSFMLVATGSPSGPLCSALTVFRLVPPT